MPLHSDLLDQAEHLLRRERKRPKQASLRRAISTAYYAIFHLLTFEAARVFAKDDMLIHCIVRLFRHDEMRDVSERFAKGDWPRCFNQVKSSYTVPQELKDVAKAFVILQQHRHDADYDMSANFTRVDSGDLLNLARTAINTWEVIRKSDLARIYLISFLLDRQFNRQR